MEHHLGHHLRHHYREQQHKAQEQLSLLARRLRPQALGGCSASIGRRGTPMPIQRRTDRSSTGEVSPSLSYEPSQYSIWKVYELLV